MIMMRKQERCTGWRGDGIGKYKVGGKARGLKKEIGKMELSDLLNLPNNIFNLWCIKT